MDAVDIADIVSREWDSSAEHLESFVLRRFRGVPVDTVATGLLLFEEVLAADVAFDKTARA